MPINDKIVKKIKQHSKGEEQLENAIFKLLKAADEGKQLKRVVNTIVNDLNP